MAPGLTRATTSEWTQKSHGLVSPLPNRTIAKASRKAEKSFRVLAQNESSKSEIAELARFWEKAEFAFGARYHDWPDRHPKA